MKQKRSIIGILGGMGPQASARLVQLLVDLSAKEFGAKRGTDFPEIILDSVPVPDFISDRRNTKTALKMLSERVRMLNKTNVSILALACNTVHLLLDKLQLVSDKLFISIINATVKEVVAKGITKVGLLATPVTIEANLFQLPLQQNGIEVILPTKKQLLKLDQIIRKVIAGKINKADRLELGEIAKSLQDQGAKGIILGCTELPLVFPKRFAIPVFNSLEILARSLLEKVFR